MHSVGEDLFANPPILYSRSEILSKPYPVPKERGLYAWFFKEIPPGVPTAECVTKDGLTLLYVGISPKNLESSSNLLHRIKTHYTGNAEGSTLRRTLGVLLEEQCGFPLRRVGSGKRLTFTHLCGGATRRILLGIRISICFIGELWTLGCWKSGW